MSPLDRCGRCGRCPACRAVRKYPAKYGPLFGVTADDLGGRLPHDWAPSPVGPTPPCAHQGDDLTGPERQAAGLDHARRWLHCLHPDRPLGPHVCGCRGCGPRCPGYAAGDPE